MKIPLAFHIPSIVRCLAGVIGFLLLASTVSTILIRSGFRPNAHRWFYVNDEMNVPAFYSTLQLFTASLLLMVIGFAERARRGAFAWHWLALAAGFVVLSADEMLSLHEKLIGPTRAFLGADRPLGILYFAWVLPAFVLVVIIGAFFLRFLFHLPASTRRDFIIAASLFLGGAIGMEMLNGWQHEVDSRRLGMESYNVRDLSVTYLVLTTMEEGLEMSGILYFIRSLLLHMARTYGEVTWAFTPGNVAGSGGKGDA